jgi:uncharacterized tellurite resistance protein B-like protein
MLNSIKSYFENKLSNETKTENNTGVSKTDLASAALMIEVINSDHQLDQRETDEFLHVLETCLHIPEDDLREMVRLAEEQASKATSLFEFTRLINDEYDYQQKLQLVKNMWRVAFSDDELDKYEESLIRKVSDLIYVSHSDFIRMKLEARDA